MSKELPEYKFREVFYISLLSFYKQRSISVKMLLSKLLSVLLYKVKVI